MPQLADTERFLHAELHNKVSGARVGRVMQNKSQKPKAKRLRLNAVMPPHSAERMGAPKAKVQGMS